ncbi:MAG: hypothetical protein R3C03_02600 [Pirellulaceae bacterium]
MNLHTEINFENEICEHLADDGWLYVEDDAEGFDRSLALYPDDVVDWVKVSNPDAWKTLEKIMVTPQQRHCSNDCVRLSTSKGRSMSYGTALTFWA